MWRRSARRARFSEKVDLLLRLAYPTYNWSLAAVDADVDSATHDTVAQCGAGGQSIFDLIRTHIYTRLWRRLHAR
jgi:hypothetical protein